MFSSGSSNRKRKINTTTSIDGAADANNTAIEQIIEKLQTLETKMSEDLKKTSPIEELHLKEWMRLKTAINMRHVCIAFHRGSALYNTDSYHFLNKINRNVNPVAALTTIKSLAPVLHYRGNIVDVRRNSYIIHDTGSTPVAIMNQILFSRTYLDCAAATQLAFYLTLLDLMKFVYGPTTGAKHFNAIFCAKLNDEHNFNRLHIGIMGSYDTGTWEDFSPLHFLTQSNRNVTLQDLKNSPSQYIGLQFGIAGHPDYLKKHPSGSAQGWNVIFLGKKEKTQELLFLVPCELGQKYILTYREVVKLLANGFNQLPNFQNKEYVPSTASQAYSNGELWNDIGFNIKNIMLLLENPREFKKALSQYCSDAYQTKLLARGFSTKNYSKQVAVDCFINQGVIPTTKDDHDLVSLRFFRKSYRPDPIKLMTQDDSRLHVAYQSKRSAM